MPDPVDAYLDGAPEPQRSTLLQLRRTLRGVLPDATETISYCMPAFKIGGKAVAAYAFPKAHCSYFPHSSTVLSNSPRNWLATIGRRGR